MPDTMRGTAWHRSRESCRWALRIVPGVAKGCPGSVLLAFLAFLDELGGLAAGELLGLGFLVAMHRRSVFLRGRRGGGGRGRRGSRRRAGGEGAARGEQRGNGQCGKEFHVGLRKGAADRSEDRLHPRA